MQLLAASLKLSLHPTAILHHLEGHRPCDLDPGKLPVPPADLGAGDQLRLPQQRHLPDTCEVHLHVLNVSLGTGFLAVVAAVVPSRALGGPSEEVPGPPPEDEEDDPSDEPTHRERNRERPEDLRQLGQRGELRHRNADLQARHLEGLWPPRRGRRHQRRGGGRRGGRGHAQGERPANLVWPRAQVPNPETAPAQMQGDRQVFLQHEVRVREARKQHVLGNRLTLCRQGPCGRFPIRPQGHRMLHQVMTEFLHVQAERAGAHPDRLHAQLRRVQSGRAVRA
mmetsp:Transcript_49802/g.161041  ORF Transcript_49802/g.161041 Transcript_49802/m.161041 type:complete len:281 (-) Transcript_49802:309-1151(-)